MMHAQDELAATRRFMYALARGRVHVLLAESIGLADVKSIAKTTGFEEPLVRSVLDDLSAVNYAVEVPTPTGPKWKVFIPE